MTTARPAPSRPRNAKLLVLLVALAPAVWGAHLLISYALVPPACDLGTTVPFHLTTAVMVAAAIGVGAVGWFKSKQHDQARIGDLVAETDLERGQVRPALLRLALMLGLYFAFVIVMTGLVAVIVDPCA